MKKTPIRNRSQSDRAKLERKADGLWQEAIVSILHGRCMRCPSKYGVVGHHVQGRANKHLRHKLLNGVALCHNHHLLTESDPAEFLLWLRSDPKMKHHARFYEENHGIPPAPWHRSSIQRDIEELTELLNPKQKEK